MSAQHSRRPLSSRREWVGRVGVLAGILNVLVFLAIIGLLATSLDPRRDERLTVAFAGVIVLLVQFALALPGTALYLSFGRKTEPRKTRIFVLAGFLACLAVWIGAMLIELVFDMW